MVVSTAHRNIHLFGLRSFYDAHAYTIHLTMVVIAMLMLNLCFYSTHYVQEDAYITFRAAFNLADHGVYAYNVGEHTSGVTSEIYGFLVAGLRCVFGRWAIPAILLSGTLALLGGAYLFSLTFFDKPTQRLLSFGLIASYPVALDISSRAMEISLQVLLLSWVIYSLRAGKPSKWTLLAIALLPLVRPDAVGYALIVTILVFTFDRRYGAMSLLATGLGAALVVIANLVTTGHLITGTMRAKEVAYHPSHAVGPILKRLHMVFGEQSYLAPVPIKLFERFGLVFSVLLVGVALAGLLKDAGDRTRLKFTLLICGVLIPACYAYGGVLFPWYFWTSAWIMAGLSCVFLIRWIYRRSMPTRSVAIVAVALAWGGLIAADWVVALSQGTQECYFRAGIGRYIHSIARPGDSLLLEPAGYIPFYAQIYTADEIGLISEKVLDYRLRYGDRWYIAYLKEQRPTFLVERNPILDRKTVDSYVLPDEDWSWFNTHYHLVRHFHYNPADYFHSSFPLKLLKSTWHPDYNLYEATDSKSQALVPPQYM